EAWPDRPQRKLPGAQHLEHELFVALVDPGGRERDLPRSRHAHARVMLGTSSRHCAQRSLWPRTVSRYAFWSACVIGPTPSSWSSTDLSGVTSAAVPHMNTSSAR